MISKINIEKLSKFIKDYERKKARLANELELAKEFKNNPYTAFSAGYIGARKLEEVEKELKELEDSLVFNKEELSKFLTTMIEPQVKEIKQWTLKIEL